MAGIHEISSLPSSPSRREFGGFLAGLGLKAALVKPVAELALDIVLQQLATACRGTKAGQIENTAETSQVEDPKNIIEEYLNKFLQNDWAKKDFGDKKWQVTQVQELVTISVTDISGINIRNFPDVNVGTNEIPTGKQPPEAQFKRLKFDPAHPYTEGFTLFNEGIGLREIPGAFLYFVTIEDPTTTKAVSIWAIYWSKEGGWINTQHPHIETFAVYHNQEWLVSFRIADGNKPMSGEELFEKAAPSIFLPKAQQPQPQEPTITSPK